MTLVEERQQTAQENVKIGDYVTGLDATGINRKIALKPVVEGLKEYFDLKSTDDQSGLVTKVESTKSRKGQTLSLTFNQPIELNQAYLPLDLALSRAVDADNVGDKSVLKRNKIQVSARTL